MKINWGIRIMIFFGAFVGLILYMVAVASQQNTDLVATDYYAREIAYQEKIDQQEKAGQLHADIQFRVKENGLEVILPDGARKGTVLFQRPSDKTLDREFSIEPDSTGRQLLSLNEFRKGLYNVQVAWNDSHEQYYMEKKLIIP